MSRLSFGIEGRQPAGGVEPAAGQHLRPGSFVLHIRPEAPGSMSAGRDATGDQAAGRVDALLVSSLLHTVVCSSVYEGLARLLTAVDQPPAAVLVCMDGLGPAELEFFPIASRQRPSVSLYVYGESWSESAILRAVELGAAGRVTEESIRTIEAEFTVQPATAPADSAAAPPAVSSSLGLEPEPTSVEDQQVDDEEVQVSEEEVEDPAAAAVRVPWLRRQDVPVRIAPQERPAAVDAPGSPQPPPAEAKPAGSRPALEEPLLTPEELQALTGMDDISALAPQLRDPAKPDEPPGGSAEP